MNQQEFIESVLPSAVDIQISRGLPAAVMVAQTIQETGYGKYITKDMDTGRSSLNLFNIKGMGPAGYALAKTFEFYNGKKTNTQAKFRAYNNYEESFNDYADLILNNSRYKQAVEVANDPVKYAFAILACGYATDPGYARSLVSIMNQWKLEERVNKIMQTPSDYAKEYWEAAVKKGIFDGNNPKAPLTREMLAVILIRLGLIK